MGWLPKALARGILKKVSRGHGINLGQQGLKYRILPLTPQLAQKYKDMAVLTTRLGTMRAAKTFDEYAENRDTLLTLPEKYHNLWYFRSFSELERRAACGAQRLRVGPSVTTAQWVTVFPDSVGYMARLAAHFNATTVVTIMQRLGYTRRGLDPSQLTMHLCFLGQLHSIQPDGVRRVSKSALKKAAAARRNGYWQGRPQRICSDACGQKHRHPRARIRWEWGWRWVVAVVFLTDF